MAQTLSAGPALQRQEDEHESHGAEDVDGVAELRVRDLVVTSQAVPPAGRERRPRAAGVRRTRRWRTRPRLRVGTNRMTSRRSAATASASSTRSETGTWRHQPVGGHRSCRPPPVATGCPGLRLSHRWRRASAACDRSCGPRRAGHLCAPRVVRDADHPNPQLPPPVPASVEPVQYMPGGSPTSTPAAGDPS